MGVEFYGLHGTGNMQTRLTLGYEHPEFLSLNNGNAAALLGLLGLEHENGTGECTLPEARRAIMQARARFERKVNEFTRPTEERRGRRGARFIGGGLDEDGLAQRLDRFEAFVDVMTRMGAEIIYWG